MSTATSTEGRYDYRGVGMRLVEGSTSVRGLGYLLRSRSLQVEFVGGAIYRYHGVPCSVVASLLRAESVGKAINELVKGHYAFTKMRGPQKW